MKSVQIFLFASFFGVVLVLCPRDSVAEGSTLIDNASDPSRALISFPDYSVSPPGKWTIVVIDKKKLQFRSFDGTQTMQAGTVELHPKSSQSEDDAFRTYVHSRRDQERENIDNTALRADAINYSSNEHGKIASWCIIDLAGAAAHLTAILENRRKLLVVSYDAEKVTETEFRARAAMVTTSMTLR